MIATEVLLCLAALLLLLFKQNVGGTQMDQMLPPSEMAAVVTDEARSSEQTEETEWLAEEFSAQEDILNEAVSDEVLSEEEDENTVNPSDNWRLILVNKQHPVPEDYELMLTDGEGKFRVDERIVTDLNAMFRAAKDDGISLSIVSAYRDYEKQTQLFESKIRWYMRKGMTYMDAYSKASESVTVPGCSEHQLGLALDIVGSGHSSLTESFSETKAGKWLEKHCDEYGFILRYPKGKEYITGIIYEPWHFRYVGREAAREIMNNDLTLEEYLLDRGLQ